MTGILTLDSITALLIATVVLTAVLGMVSQPKGSDTEYLYQVSLDLLTILEENGGLHETVDGGDSRLDEVEALLPERFCYRLDVRESGVLAYTGDRGCVESQDYSIGRRAFVSGGRMYVAEMRVWFK